MRIERFLFNILVLAVLLLAGGIFFAVERPKISMTIFLFTSIIYALITKSYRKKSFLSNSIIFFTLLLFVVLSTFVFNSNAVDNTYLQYLFYSFAMCLFISSVEFDRFRNRLIFYANLICLLSIIIQVLYNLGFVQPKIQYMGGLYRTMVGSLFQVQWGGENRMSGIYWEPGQYQIVIIFVLCLFIDELKTLKIKYIVKRFGLIFLALLMTRSTTGYIVFAILIMIILSFSEYSKSHRLLIPGVVFISVCVGYLILSGSVVQEKFAQDEDASSYMIRMADNQALLKITMENPIFGLGVETKQLKIQKKQYGSETSSNGWLNASASLGLLYVGFIFVCMYKRIKKMNFKVPTVLIMLVLFVSQCNEAALYLPYIYMYIYIYADYSMKQKQNNDGKKSLVHNNNKL